jgi:hypothetical protein
MIAQQAYHNHVEQLFDRACRLHAAMSEAGLIYRVVGGLAVYLQISERYPGRARMTEDVDVAVRRTDLKRIAQAAERHGFKYRHVAGVDMLVDVDRPRAANAVHLIFIGEKVRPEYLEAVPEFSAPKITPDGLLVASVADLVKMKLTSFRQKDKTHIKDLDSVRLITREVEESLPQELRERLAEVRASR